MAESLTVQEERDLLLSPVPKSLVIVIPEADQEMKDLSAEKQKSTPTTTSTDCSSEEDAKKKRQRWKESSSERELRKKQERTEKRKKVEQEERRQKEKDERRREEQWQPTLQSNERKGKTEPIVIILKSVNGMISLQGDAINVANAGTGGENVEINRRDKESGKSFIISMEIVI